MNVIQKFIVGAVIVALFVVYATNEPDQRLPEPAVKYPFIVIPIQK